jgi:deoxyribonuclease IV
MDRLLFGTGGTPNSTKGNSTIEGIERIAELGLDCMELEFVRGVHMGAETAAKVKEVATRLGVRLTVHAPYYINFNSSEPDKQSASQKRLLQSARIGALCGAESVAFHAAVYSGMDRDSVYKSVANGMKAVAATLEAEDNKLWLRPELMGRNSQFGTIEELVLLSREVPRAAPCVDFAHFHARTGKDNSYAEFSRVLKAIGDGLGRKYLENMHIHTSGIAYSQAGELKHLNLKDSDMKYEELMQALKDFDVRGFIICESPNLEDDARLMKETYSRLKRRT